MRPTTLHPFTDAVRNKTYGVDAGEAAISTVRSETTSAELPTWLRTPSDSAALPELRGRGPNPFIERTVGEIAAAAGAALHGEQYARQEGYLQARDPRAKLIAILFLIVVVSFLHRPITLLALYALTLGLAYASRLPLKMMIQRVWLSIPIFVGGITLPAAFNVVTPGRELFVVWAHPHLAVTAAGLAASFLLTLRVGAAVSLAVLLTLTTRWNDLLRALRATFAPRLFISVLAMTYRYVTVLLETAGEMFIARRSRTVGRATNAEGRRFVGASVGALFGKTLALSDEVHNAMVSRGFNGDMRTLTRRRWSAGDTLWMLAVVWIALCALGGERF